MQIGNLGKKRFFVGITKENIVDVSQLENDGVAFFGADSRPSKRTTLIVGVQRSGTTMPATALFHLGVFMGDGVGKGEFEGARLAHTFEKNLKPLLTLLVVTINASISGLQLAFGMECH